MRTPITFALLTAFALAGCSGGGAGGPVTPNNSNSGSSASSTQDVAQSGVTAGTDPILQGDLENGVTNGTYSAGAAGSGAAARPLVAGGVCHNHVERTITVVSPTETKYDVKYFYDAGCTQLAREVQSDVVNPGTGMTIVRSAINYNLTGAVLTSRATNYSIAGTVSSGNFTQVLTSALTIGTSSTPAAQLGRTDTFAMTAPGSGALTGNSGRVVNPSGPSVSASYGHAAQLAGATWSVDSSGNVTFGGERDGTLYKGPYLGLVLASAPPFGVTGGTQIGGSKITGSVSFDADGNLTSVNLNGTFLNGDTLSVTSSGSPLSVNGTIATSSGAPVATFAVDQYGDGTITYANGSTGLIEDWHLVR